MISDSERRGTTFPSRAYLFEAKGIQRWVLEGGRLRDIAAASNLLARTAASDNDDLLQQILRQTKFAPDFSRRAGGAFMLHYEIQKTNVEEAFERFRAQWRLVFMKLLPGLEFVESFGRGITPLEARKNAYSARPQTRRAAGRENGASTLLPLGHPLVELVPRTGRPATEALNYAEGVELLDLVTGAKRRANRDVGTLEAKFCPKDVDPATLLWPDQMESESADGDQATNFPFDGEEQWIAVMHADISALGALYETIGKVAEQQGHAQKGLQTAREAATAIEEALIAASRAATKATLLGHGKKVDIGGKQYRVMPARPVLLGGDDITLILRGDAALPFTRCFLEALENESQVKLKEFVTRYELKLSEEDRGKIEVQLTATAGIAFGKPKQPFFRLLVLAESLCGYAKRRAKAKMNGGRAASLIAFHRVTESALAADADELFDRLALDDDRRLTRQHYRVGTVDADFVLLTELEALKEILDQGGLKSGGLRQLRALLLQRLDDQATEAWRRWCEMARKHSEETFKKFQQKLNAACSNPDMDISKLEFIFASSGATKATPLFDAMEWGGVS